VKILNVGYRSVNCYLIVTERSKLLIDVGWPGGIPELKASLTNEGYSIRDITHVLVTHYHMDHGAISQELKDKGAKLIVIENQVAHLNDQKRFIRPPMVYHEIMEEGNIVLSLAESRIFLKGLGIDGEIIATPGHGEDHCTLVLDEGVAFTGDLPPLNGSPEGSDAARDWVRLRSMNVKWVYPAHGASPLSLG
jgi:glyoxylase-like metal-dependent hydrolase (beta-lactamase superfamily II)